MRYQLPLDCKLTEYIFAPFYDPEHSHWIPVEIDSSSHLKIMRESQWDRTIFSWPARNNINFTLRILAPFNAKMYDEIIICLSLPKMAKVKFALLNSKGKLCGAWSPFFEGNGARQEIIYKINKLIRFRGLFRRNPEFGGLALNVISRKTPLGQLSLSWLGMRNSLIDAQTKLFYKEKIIDWSPWILPVQEWGPTRFEKGLIFDAEDLPAIRKKLLLSGWKEHFALLESNANKYLLRDPEVDFNTYLPNHDYRYIRQYETGRTSFHWEALVLAFVGLVKENQKMIHHALRYLMCMVHTRFWTESGEHNIPSITWVHLCFMEEMTTTSVSLLYDWLGFALYPRTKNLIRKAIWEKGVAIVARDVFSREQIHYMNQGAVFCRAIVLGGLILESAWPKFQKDIIDHAYETMTKVLKNYIKSDGGVHEGIGYLCQTLTACLWTIIAYCRDRSINWNDEITRLFSAVAQYASVMSTTHPGKMIPAGDCRVDWFGGDVIPIFAAVFPNSPFADMLHNCLLQGSIHELTGTLSKSGGLIGMIYGPDIVLPSRNVAPQYALLSESSKIALSLSTADTLKAHLWISGSTAKGATHTHRDNGQFYLEVEQEPIFIDRGMVQYWFIEASFLSRSYLHNVITPLSGEGEYVNQGVPLENSPLSVSENHQTIRVPGNGVWNDYMKSYERIFIIEKAPSMKIIDNCCLLNSTRLAFHLHSPMEFQIEGTQAVLKKPAYTIKISCPWAEHIACEKVLVDLHHQPIFHLVSTSPMLKGDIQLETVLRISNETTLDVDVC
jgi:hypothetical protein